MEKQKRIFAWVMVFLILFGTIAFAVGSLVSWAEEAGLQPMSAGDDIVSIPTEPTVWVESSLPTIAKDEPVDLTIRIVDPQVSKRPQQGGTIDFGGYLTVTQDDGSGARVTVSGMTSNGFSGGNALVAKVVSVDHYDLKDTSYLQYTVKLENVLYTNTSSNLLKFKVEEESVQGYSRSFSVDMTDFLSDYTPPVTPSRPGTDDDEDEEEDEEERPDIATAKPYIIVSDYDYGGSAVMAGSTFDLAITFRNTSRWVDVENIVVTVATSEGLAIVNSSNTFYVEDLESRSAMTKKFTLRVQPGVEPGSESVDITFKYQYVADDARSDLETSEKIAIPVQQLDRFQVDPIEMVDQVMVGEDYTMTVKYVNKGRSSVYNLSAEIQGNILAPGQRQNIGNIEAGKSGEIDFDVQSNDPGTVEGTVILTYEDLNMNVSTVEVPFTTQIVDPNAGMEFPTDDIMGDGMEVPMEPETTQPSVWIYVAVGAGVLAAILLLVVHKKRKAAKLLAELEDDDEDI